MARVLPQGFRRVLISKLMCISPQFRPQCGRPGDTRALELARPCAYRQTDGRPNRGGFWDFRV